MWLIVGLGNPGPHYSDHRHNVGFMVIDELKSRWGGSRSKIEWGSEWVELSFKNQKVFLQKPMEFMNLSGVAIQKLSRFFQIPLSQLIVIHDELDISFGKIRVKVNGGHGGHNGLRSVSSCVGTDYIRVRFGIGRPVNEKEQVVNYVLAPFNSEQKKELPFLLQNSVDIVESILMRGAKETMNLYHK